MNARVSFRLVCLFLVARRVATYTQKYAAVYTLSPDVDILTNLTHGRGRPTARLKFIVVEAISYSQRLFHIRIGYFIFVQAISYSYRLFHIRIGYFILVQAISYSYRLFHTRRGYFILVQAISYSQMLFHTNRGYFTLVDAI